MPSAIDSIHVPMFETNAPVHSRAYAGCRSGAIASKRARESRGFGYRFRHCGARFSRNARMPSCASSACALSTITGTAMSYAAASGSLVLRVERALAEREHVRARLRDPAGERDDLGLELVARARRG